MPFVERRPSDEIEINKEKNNNNNKRLFNRLRNFYDTI